MGRIKIKKQAPTKRRATVVVKPETYARIYNISLEANAPVETVVDILLQEALKDVEVVE